VEDVGPEGSVVLQTTGIDVGSQIVTGDAGRSLRLEDEFSRQKLPLSEPIRDVLLFCAGKALES
jgi:hypothetical protein